MALQNFELWTLLVNSEGDVLRLPQLVELSIDAKTKLPILLFEILLDLDVKGRSHLAEPAERAVDVVEVMHAAHQLDFVVVYFLF